MIKGISTTTDEERLTIMRPAHVLLSMSRGGKCLLWVVLCLSASNPTGGGSWAESGRPATAAPWILYLGLFSHFQGILHFNAQISDRAFELGVPEQ